MTDFGKFPENDDSNAAYIEQAAIGSIHDRHTRDDLLARIDLQILSREIQAASGSWIADFGCGTGRTFSVIRNKGWRPVGIDLSKSMLESAGRCDPDALLIQTPLDGLTGIADGVFAGGVCLYSTLGMIRGRRNRLRFLAGAHRTIVPGGKLIVHAHNRWNLRKFPGGWRWIATSAFSSLFGKQEFGDRWASVPGISRLFIHSFSFFSFTKELVDAGWTVGEVFPYFAGENPMASAAELPPLARLDELTRVDRIEATGWIAVCRR